MQKTLDQQANKEVFEQPKETWVQLYLQILIIKALPKEIKSKL